MAIRLPGPESVQQVGIARDPGSRAHPDDFGAQIGRAQQEFAGAVAVVGQIGQRLARERQDATDKVFADTFDLEYSAAAQKEYMDAQTGANLDGSGFAQDVDRRLESLSESTLNNLRERGFNPSQRAMAAIQGAALRNRADYLVKAETWAHNRNVTMLGEQLDKNAAAVSASVLETGDLDGALDRIDQTLENYGGVLPAEAIADKRNEYREQTVDAHIAALQQAGLYDEAAAVVGRFYGADPRGTDYEARVRQVESGGDPNAAAATSSALGPHQFVNSTWLQYVRDLDPEWAAGLSKAEILAARTDPEKSLEVFQAFTADNAEYLGNRGLPANDANLYLAHFLGAGDAVRVLKADPSTPLSEIVGADKIAANKSIMAGKTAGDLAAWSASKMAGTPQKGKAPEMADAGKALQWYSRISSAERGAYEQEQRAEREFKYAVTKDGYDMVRDDSMTQEWLDANRDILNVSDYRAFSHALEPDYTPKATPPAEYLRLLDLADNDPETAIREVRDSYADNIIAKDVFNTVMSRARANLREAGGRSYAGELRSYVSKAMTPPAGSPQSLDARKLDALFAFDDWLENNRSAPREEIRKQAQAVIDDFRKIRYESGVTTMPLPRFVGKTAETMTEADLDFAKGKTLLALRGGTISEREAAEQAALLRRWGDLIRYRD